jgi:hypothetical protein
MVRTLTCEILLANATSVLPDTRWLPCRALRLDYALTPTVAVQGPLLRAAVGDVMEVHLLNNLSFPINIVPGGVVSSAHQAVKVAGPGDTVVYAWSVPAEVRITVHTSRPKTTSVK